MLIGVFNCHVPPAWFHITSQGQPFLEPPAHPRSASDLRQLEAEPTS